MKKRRGQQGSAGHSHFGSIKAEPGGGAYLDDGRLRVAVVVGVAGEALAEAGLAVAGTTVGALGDVLVVRRQLGSDDALVVTVINVSALNPDTSASRDGTGPVSLDGRSDSLAVARDTGIVEFARRGVGVVVTSSGSAEPTATEAPGKRVARNGKEVLRAGEDINRNLALSARLVVGEDAVRLALVQRRGAVEVGNGLLDPLADVVRGVEVVVCVGVRSSVGPVDEGGETEVVCGGCRRLTPDTLFIVDLDERGLVAR